MYNRIIVSKLTLYQVINLAGSAIENRAQNASLPASAPALPRPRAWVKTAGIARARVEVQDTIDDWNGSIELKPPDSNRYKAIVEFPMYRSSFISQVFGLDAALHRYIQTSSTSYSTRDVTTRAHFCTKEKLRVRV